MARARAQAGGDTATRILDEAEKLIQRRGYNGFSYADVASTLSITTASLHYHFAGKAQLGQALIERYSTRFMDALAAIDRRVPDGPGRLKAYANLYAAPLRERRLCLCGMLAADYQTLPKPMRQAVLDFFDQNEAWLAGVLEAGREDGKLQFTGSTSDTARMIVSSLEGAMLIARPYGDTSRFQITAAQLLSNLNSAAPTQA